MCFVDGSREPSKYNYSEWVKISNNLGFGELFITSIDQEGTGKGFDIEVVDF